MTNEHSAPSASAARPEPAAPTATPTLAPQAAPATPMPPAPPAAAPAATSSQPAASAARPDLAPNTDMLAAARDAQWSPTTFLGPGSLKLVSPAKVNLLLAIGDRRPDGYHEARTIMHALALHDTLYVAAAPATADEVAQAAAAARTDQAVGGPADNLLVTIDLSDRTGADLAVPAAANLVFKAADRLARALGRELPECLSVRIEKHIPAQGGLGGGSSNAATMLVALARLWNVAPDDGRVEEVARSLGADVAFFLRGGCAQLGGTGETWERSLTPSNQAVVLVKPAAGVSTAEAYRAFDTNPMPVAPSVLATADAAEAAAEVPLANNLAAPAEVLLPELAEVRAWLAARAGAENVLLCGSGSTTFALVDTFEEASTLAVEAGKRGWWARPTNLSALRAAVVPCRR